MWRQSNSRVTRVLRALCRAALAMTLALVASAVSAGASGAPSSVAVGGVPLPAHAASVGTVAPSTRLGLTVVFTPRNPIDLTALAAAVSNPASPSYHHYLSVGEFAARFGASGASVAAVRKTMRADGLTLGALARDRLSIAISGTAAEASRAFDVNLRRYRVRSGREVYANTSAPRVPVGLGGVVAAVLGLDDLPAAAPEGLDAIHASPLAPVQPRAAAHAASSSFPGGGGPLPCAAATSFAASKPAVSTIDQIGKAYGFSGLYADGDFGQGVTVALLELEPYASEASDLKSFQQCFGTDAQITDIPVEGGSPLTVRTAESAVDLENLIGLAPDVRVEVYYGPNAGNGPYDTLATIVDAPTGQHAQVINNSWGLCEPDSSATTVEQENILLEQADLEGETFISSSGDRGAEGCATQWNNNLNVPSQQLDPNAAELAVDDPASQPYATAVGGTNLNAVGPPPSETAWEQLYWGASGGGISRFWQMPGWQLYSGVPGVLNSYSSGTPCAETSGYCREVPDVSADGSTETGYATFYEGSWSAWGGTSTAAPDWAALAALADSSANPYPGCSTPFGFLNPLLYEIAAGDNHADAFNNITVGNNSGYFNGTVPYGAYPATPGYDMVTGLGTPIATDGSLPGLVAQLCEAAATPVGPAPTVSGLGAPEASAGATVTITGSGFTPFAAVWFGSAAATAVTYDSSTQLSATVPPGSGSVNVTVTKLSGASPTSLADAFTYAPTETISSPALGATYTQGQPLTAAYSCAASTSGAPSCSGPVPTGGTVDTSSIGPHQFSVTATDANEFATTTTATYTVVAPPTIAVSGLSSGATYAQGQALSARVTCTASAPVTIASCTAPSAVDTSATGPHIFAVHATDSNGVTITDVITYTVAAVPTATVHTPANGAFYLRGQAVTAAFGCKAVAPATVVSCSASAANGARIDTATLGRHRFTLTATDSNGVGSTANVSYTVVAVRPELSDVSEAASRWVERRGSGARAPVGTTFSFSLDQPARVTLSFARTTSGRVADGRCVSSRLAAQQAKPCTWSVAAGTLAVTAEPGANALDFAGHTSAGQLPAGTYKVVLRATGLGGRPSVAVSLRFTIAAAKR
jgi:subtilase family serine protease